MGQAEKLGYSNREFFKLYGPAGSAGENLIERGELGESLSFKTLFEAKVTLTPERRLMLAILEDAARQYQKHFPLRDRKAESRMIVLEIEQWLNATSDKWPFSFVNICQTLNFNESYLRDGLRKLRDPQRPKLAFHPCHVGRRRLIVAKKS